MNSKSLLVCVIFALYSCQNKESKSTNIIEKIAKDTLTKTAAGTADVSDAPVKKNKEVELIRKWLPKLLKDDLEILTKEDRYFYYEAFDLNNDGKNEYFVGFSDSYFCNSEGCLFFLLKNDGTVLSKMKVTKFPIYIATSSTENFFDLIIEYEEKHHIVKMRKGQYPNTISDLPLLKGNSTNEKTKILDISRMNMESYPY